MFKTEVALSLCFSSSKNCFAEAKGGFISLELHGAVSSWIARALGVQLLMGRFEMHLGKFCPGDLVTLRFISVPTGKRVTQNISDGL